MTIFLDPGHNLSNDSGAQGIKSEDDLIIQVVSRLTSILKKAGQEVVNVLPKGARDLDESLERRVAKANRKGRQGDLFVSVHFNAFNRKAHGTETYAYGNKGLNLARQINKAIALLGFYDRGAKQAKFYVLRNTKITAVLVECCFCDSATDMDRFDPEKMAKAIAQGIFNYLGIDDEPEEPTKIRIHTDTWIKELPEQSGSLNSKQKDPLKVGVYTLLDAEPEEEAHYHVRLKSGLAGYVYSGHCDLLD